MGSSLPMSSPMQKTFEKARSLGHWPRKCWWFAKMLCLLNFLSYFLIKVQILWNCYLYYTNYSFRCKFEPFKRYFQWQTSHNCGNLKPSICKNLSVEGITDRSTYWDGADLKRCWNCLHIFCKTSSKLRWHCQQKRNA